jgi:3-hydroxyacyl-CoA dehydrogenase
MPEQIKKAAVIGSGVMGSQIAAHLANAGIEVLLMDIVPEGAPEANHLAKSALERMKSMTPPPSCIRISSSASPPPTCAMT